MTRRVVVAGHGLAAARFVAELTASASDMAVTVLGDEPCGGYNRVLLTSVLAGECGLADVFVHDRAWYADRGVTVRDDCPVTGIDRGRSVVRCADGSQAWYDMLVLATGAAPRVPAVPGLRPGASGRLLGGCHLFRTLADCEALLAEAGDARRAVVAGGGVLGLEAARALAGLGVPVHLVHRTGSLMDAQLDRDASAVLRRVVQDLGITCHLAAEPRAVRGTAGRVTGVVLADGTTLGCDLLVLACGARPDTRLATAAGLAAGRGVVVDDAMRSISDPRVVAIGDCAQHRGRVHGLAAPAFEQAAVAAAAVAGSCGDGPAAAAPAAGGPAYRGSRLVTRLKASGIELAAMGDTGAESHDEGGPEVIKYIDPVRGTYFKLVIAGGRLAGALVLGDADAAAAVTVAYDRQSILPPDRARLLFEGCGPAASPADLPAEAVVCRCNAVTAGEVRACAEGGAASVAAIARTTMATTGCGTCRPAVAALLAEAPATFGPVTAGALTGPAASTDPGTEAVWTTW
jgi:assimilatory nitrate reductase electron transfer subunit